MSHVHDVFSLIWHLCKMPESFSTGIAIVLLNTERTGAVVFRNIAEIFYVTDFFLLACDFFEET